MDSPRGLVASHVRETNCAGQRLRHRQRTPGYRGGIGGHRGPAPTVLVLRVADGGGSQYDWRKSHNRKGSTDGIS
jgi:hypothetical protein